jgi:hypothetical protein
MKSLIEWIIRKRNPQFSFDKALNTKTLIGFIWMQFCGIVRGCKLLFCMRNPKLAILGHNVRFFNLTKISFGHFMKLGDNVFISALGTEGVNFGDNVGIGAYSRVIISTSFNNLGSYISIGNNVSIGEFAYLGGDWG